MEKIKFKLKIQFFEMVGNMYIISIFYFELLFIYEVVLKEIEMEMQKFLLGSVEEVKDEVDRKLDDGKDNFFK